MQESRALWVQGKQGMDEGIRPSQTRELVVWDCEGGTEGPAKAPTGSCEALGWAGGYDRALGQTCPATEVGPGGKPLEMSRVGLWGGYWGS